MRRRTFTRIVAGVLTIGLVAGVLLILFRDSEPRHRGKRISEWAFQMVYDTPQKNEEACAAIKELGQAAVLPLIRMLEKRDSKLALFLQRTLPKVPWPDWFDMPASSFHAGAATALRELGPLARPAIPALEKVAEDRDTFVASKAKAALLVIRNQSTDSLAAMLQNRDPAHLSNWVVAAGVASELGESARRFIPLFVESLQDTNPLVRLRATSALGAIGLLEPEISVPALVKGFNDPDPIVRQQSLFVLYRFPEAIARAQPQIEQRLSDPDNYTRLMAVLLLTQASATLDTNSAIKAAQPLLNDPDQMVRGTAENLLKQLGKPRE
jgi:hypothetical protein